MTRQTTLSLIKVQRYVYAWSEVSEVLCHILSAQALDTKLFDKHSPTENKMATWISILKSSNYKGGEEEGKVLSAGSFPATTSRSEWESS